MGGGVTAALKGTMDQPRMTQAEQALRLSRLADAIASRFASKQSHPVLWKIYRKNAYDVIVQHLVRDEEQPPCAQRT